MASFPQALCSATLRSHPLSQGLSVIVSICLWLCLHLSLSRSSSVSVCVCLCLPFSHPVTPPSNLLVSLLIMFSLHRGSTPQGPWSLHWKVWGGSSHPWDKHAHLLSFSHPISSCTGGKVRPSSLSRAKTKLKFGLWKGEDWFFKQGNLAEEKEFSIMSVNWQCGWEPQPREVIEPGLPPVCIYFPQGPHTRWGWGEND